MRKRLTLTLALAVAIGTLGAQEKGKGGGKGKGPNLPPSIVLTVAGMTDAGRFPAANAGPAGPSPALSWISVPAGTQSFTILFHDPDPVINRNASTDVTHWLIYNIPGTATGLPAGVPAGAELPDGSRQAPNITGQPAYFGPAPPAGHGVHHYTFEIWALDSKIEVPAGTAPADVRNAIIKAMDGHVLAKGVTIGLYSNE
jgi:hypothetical protein